jgi:hypothetical protein
MNNRACTCVRSNATRPIDVNPYWLPPEIRDGFFVLYAAMLCRVAHELAQAISWAIAPLRS